MRQRLTIESIKQTLESEEGYKLLSTEYTNRVKLEIKCPNNHIFFMRYDGFQSGYRCKECYFNRKRHSLDYIKEQIEKIDGYKLLSTEYNIVQDILELQCPENHIFNLSYISFQQGSRCLVCFDIRNKQYCIEKRLSPIFVKQSIENEGYKLLSEYTTCRQKLTIQCDKEHIYEATWSTFKSGSRCPICSNINNWKNCTKSKDYTLPSGKVIKYQGYENTVIDILLMIYKEEEIDIHPNLIINYKLDDKNRKHYPDIFIPKENTIVEVKSKFTYFNCEEKNIEKQKAAKALGYKYEYWIISDNRDLFDIID